MPSYDFVPDPGRPDAWTLRVDGADQSHVDLADPTHLEFDYVRRMGDMLDALAPAGERLRVVHVGGAAMTLPRYLAHTRPSSAQIVLEPDTELTDLVRRDLPLPARSGIKVRPVDGATGVAALRDDYADVLILDAYQGARVPAELTTTEFFADVQRVLVSGGTLLANLADRAPFDYLRGCVAAIRDSFGSLLVAAEPATLKGRRFGNLLVVASDEDVPTAELARRAASSPLPYRVVTPDRVSSSFGGGRAWTAARSSPSPSPPGGAAFFS